MMPAPSADGQLRAHLFIAPMREFGSEGKHWSPCASTLVTGETEAVLTDTGHIKSDVRALGDMIERTGKRLTTIFITHGHLDHFLGIGQLMQRFPDARPVATPAVVADLSDRGHRLSQGDLQSTQVVGRAAVVRDRLLERSRPRRALRRHGAT
jgi:glyoxylase-like metal-dependent hydrolase (beta-lactamase superfamily II)